VAQTAFATARATTNRGARWGKAPNLSLGATNKKKAVKNKTKTGKKKKKKDAGQKKQ